MANTSTRYFFICAAGTRTYWFAGFRIPLPPPPPRYDIWSWWLYLYIFSPRDLFGTKIAGGREGDCLWVGRCRGCLRAARQSPFSQWQPGTILTNVLFRGMQECCGFVLGFVLNSFTCLNRGGLKMTCICLHPKHESHLINIHVEA